MGEPLEYAIRHLADRDEKIRQAAVKTIKSDPDRTLEYLIETLRSNPGVRWRALCALKYVDHNLIAALPVVLPHLHDVNRLCRMEAVELIVKMGTEAKAAVQDLIRILEDRDEEFRTLALTGLVQIGLAPTDMAAIVPLGGILQDLLAANENSSFESVRKTADLLRSIGPTAAPTLIKCLRKAVRSSGSSLLDGYESWYVKPVFEALGKLLPQTKGVAQKLLALLQLERTPESFRRDVLLALGCIGPADADRVVNALIDFRMDAEYEQLFEALFTAFDRIGLLAVPILIGILNDHDDEKSSFAARILGHYNDPDNPAWVDEKLQQVARNSIPALIAAFVSGGPELRVSSAYALSTMGSDAKGAVPVLTDALQGHGREVREAARHALRLIIDCPAAGSGLRTV